MALKPLKDFFGRIFRKEAAAKTYDATQEGLLYNNNDAELRVQIQGADRALVTNSQTQTLTNKSIDADTNTITNIENADIKAAAAIDASKIADGSVSNTEFQYINSVTSNVQTQIDSKASSSDLTNHINNTTDAHDASAISNIPSGNLAATEVQAALNELQSDIDTRALSSSLTSHTGASTGVHGVIGSVVGTSDTQTLTNKSINADNNTITNIDNNDIKAAAAIDASKIADGSVSSTEFQFINSVTSNVQTQLDNKQPLDSTLTSLATYNTNGIISQTAADTFTGRTITGTTNQITLTNGDGVSGNPTAAIANNVVLPGNASATLPIGTTAQRSGSPVNGMIRYNSDLTSFEGYANSTWGALGGSGGSNTDVVYIDHSFESGITGWATYADAAATTPVDGTGGSANITLTQNSTTPLRKTADGLITKDAANRQGQGISYDFSINNTDKAKMLTVKFDFKTSTNYVDNDIKVFVYDVTNATLIRLVPEDLLATATTGVFQGSFQTSTSSTSYRLIIHISSVNANAYTINIDNVNIKPNSSAGSSSIVAARVYMGSNQTMTTSNTFYLMNYDTKTLDTTNSFDTTNKYYVVPESGYYLVSACVYETNTNLEGAVTTYIMKNATTIDSSTAIAAATKFSGTGTQNKARTTECRNIAYLVKGDILRVYAAQTYGSNFLFEANQSLTQFTVVKLPSSSADQTSSGNIIVTHATRNSNQSTSTSTEATVVFDRIIFDTTNSFNTSTGTFTTPESGYYSINAIIGWGASATGRRDARIYINGVSVCYTVSIVNSATDGAELPINTLRFLAKGDTVVVKVLQTSGSTLVIAGTSGNELVTSITIEKIPTPQLGSTSEKVAFSATQNSGQSLTNNVETTVIFNTVSYDTHAAYNSSNGQYTIPVSGYYNICAHIYWAARAYTNNENYLFIKDTNSTKGKYTQMFLPSGNDTISQNISGDLYFNKGEIVYIRAITQGATNTLVSNSLYNGVSIHLIK